MSAPAPAPCVLRELLGPRRLTEVVDIGASPLDGGAPPYADLLAAGLCRVTGFEPQPDALAQLNATAGANERYFPFAIGDGGDHVLHVCAGTGMTSLLEPDPVMLGLFAALQPLGEVVRRVPTTTRKLDDVDEIEHIDFLRIDVQGGELAVFRSGAKKLAETIAVDVEVSFLTLYRDQPTFGDVDRELRSQGFLPHCFAEIKHWPIAPAVINRDPVTPLRQVLEANLVYVRDFAHPERMTDEQLRHLAIVADEMYGSFDLALRCVMLLEERGSLEAGSQRAYLAAIEERARRA